MRRVSCLLLALLLPVALAVCPYTTPRAWRIAVARPNNLDGQRVVNAIQTLIAQTLSNTSSLYLQYDSIQFSQNDIFDDQCNSLPALSVGAADTLNVLVSGNTPVEPAEVIVGGSCTAFNQRFLTQRNSISATKPALLSSLDYSSAFSSAATYPSFIRGNINPTDEADNVYAMLDYHKLYSVGVMCSVDTPGANFCSNFATTVASTGVDALIVSTFPETYDATVAATVALIADTLTAFRAQHRNVIIMYLKLDICQAVMNKMYELNMFGSNYHIILAPYLQTSMLFTNEATYQVANGAIMIAPISGQSAYTTLQFSTTYASQNFLLGGDSAGYLGQNAYDAALYFVYGIKAMRTACNSATDGASLLAAMRSASFSGIYGPSQLATGKNDRIIPSMYTIYNVVGLNFIQVGTITNRAVVITTAIVFPGSNTAPITQWRVGLMYSSNSQINRNVLNMTQWTIATVNSLSVTSALTPYSGRHKLVLLSSQIAVDDCGATAGLALTGLNTILNNNNAYSFKAGTRNPFVIIGPGCSSIVTDTTFFAAMQSSGIPFIVYGSSPFFFASKVSNIVRISFADATEAQLMASVASYFGWIRSSVVYTNDTLNTNLYNSFGTIGGQYGIRASNTQFLTASTTAANFASYWSTQISTSVLAALCFLGTGADPLNPRYFLQQQALNNGLGKTQLLIGSGFPAAVPSLPLSLQAVAQGTLYINKSFDTSIPQFSALVQSWLSAKPTLTDVDHLPYIYDAVFTALSALGATLTQSVDPYASPSTFSTNLHSVQFVGTLGHVNFTSTSSDRLMAPGYYRVQSYRTDGNHDTIGTADATGNFAIAKSPLKWANNADQPTQACTRGSVGVSTASTIGVRNLCQPCAAGTFAYVGGTVCNNCSATSVCPIASWITGGWSPSIPVLRSASTTFPVSIGPYLSNADITWFDIKYAIIGGALVVGTALISSIAMLLCPNHFGPFISTFDGFTADHPVENGKPLVIRSTPMGGYCSLMCLCLITTALAYFGNRYLVNKYTIVNAQLLGTSTLVDPDPFQFQLTYYAFDNFHECAAICTRPGMATGITGTFTCVGDTVLTTCTVSFKVDQASVQLPLKFSFQINLLNNHVYGMYLNIIGTKFLGKEYGYSTPVRADSGKVLFGYKASTVFNIDLQPYTFTGQADLQDAPQHAAGYYVLPNSVTRGPQEGISAWTNADAFQNSAGAFVTINFARTNSVNAYYLSPQVDFITVLSNITALGIALALYITRGGMRLLEALPSAMEVVSLWFERLSDPDAAIKEANEAKAAAAKRREEEEKELAAEEGAVLSPDAVALQTMLLAVQSQAEQNELVRQQTVRDMDRVTERVAQLKKEAAEKAIANALEAAKAAEQAELDGIAPGTKGHQGPSQDELTAASVYPWKGVVTELLTHCQPRDLVSAVSYTAERDTEAMKLLAEVFAPYLHQRAMELRPSNAMAHHAASNSSGAAIRAASQRK